MKRKKNIPMIVSMLAVGLVLCGIFGFAGSQQRGYNITVYKVDFDDCRCYIEEHLEVGIYCDPNICPPNCKAHKQEKVIARERKMCKEGLLWDRFKLKGSKPEKRVDKCTHDTMCLLRTKPKLGILPLQHNENKN